MPQHLRLISHKLCPYVQRAVIIAAEKGIALERIDIDLANKPDWFLALSPTGKVPLLEEIDEYGVSHILFESAVIAEYFDEIGGRRLLPADPRERARQRAWVEFASATLNDIAKLYSEPTSVGFEAAKHMLNRRFSSLRTEIAGPWFAGESFGLVDAAFAPAFRYVDIFERRTATNIIDRSLELTAWSLALADRPSVVAAVPPDYEQRLIDFVLGKDSYLAGLLLTQAPKAA